MRAVRACCESKRAGFSLIEAALAVVVLSISAVAVIVLLSGGLDVGLEASADIQAATFAESVLECLRAENAVACCETGLWHEFWTDFAAGSGSVPVAWPGGWLPDTLSVGVRDPEFGPPNTIVFSNRPYRAVCETGVVSFVIRYGLDVAFHETGGATNTTNRADVTLWVWNGESVSNVLADAKVFYSEYLDTGGL